MHIHQAIQNQYMAALEMVKEAIIYCPPSGWDDPQSAKKFWHVAYHTLFYTHLYLQASINSFSAWPKHRPEYNNLDAPSSTPQEIPALEAYSKEEILEYLEFCQKQVTEQIHGMDLEADSGFHWLPFNKMELQIYNIRHLQNHAAELAEWLAANQGIQIHWVGSKPAGETA